MIKKILVFVILLNSILVSDFIRTEKSETVLDTSTNLLWLDSNIVKSKKTFIESITTCETLDIYGYDKWRVPNYNELYSILDINNINGVLNSKFINNENGKYWTSTISKLHYDNNKTRLWTINFNNGHDDLIPADYSGDVYVRCVHSGH